jgi:hypothetical protein
MSQFAEAGGSLFGLSQQLAGLPELLTGRRKLLPVDRPDSGGRVADYLTAQGQNLFPGLVLGGKGFADLLGNRV